VDVAMMWQWLHGGSSSVLALKFKNVNVPCILAAQLIVEWKKKYYGRGIPKTLAVKPFGGLTIYFLNNDLSALC